MGLPENIQITTTNFREKTIFTYEYRYFVSMYGWEARAFIGHCLSRWSDEFEHLLDDWGNDHGYPELEIVSYWGPRFVKKYKEEYPACDEHFYRNIFRSELRSLTLPLKSIQYYFEKKEFERDKESGQKYFNRFRNYFRLDIKPLPEGWIRFGVVGEDGNLSLSEEILALAGNMEVEEITRKISWLLSGFIEHFEIFMVDQKNIITINKKLCKILSKNYPEMSGKGKLEPAWFEDIYRAKFLSVRIPEQLLKPVFQK
jgi:hypothetical protein